MILSMELVRLLADPLASLPMNEDFYFQSLEEINQDGISSQIYFLLKQKDMLARTPLFFQNDLREKYDKNLYQNLYIKNEMNQILSVFEENKLEVIPIKGVSFAEKYFHHVGARPTSDIDLLIRQGDLNKAIKLVKALGFDIEEEQIPDHFHYSLSKRLPGSSIPLTVELHWDLIKKNTANFNIDGFWGQATQKESFQYIKEFSDYHTFYLICLHGWRHNLNSLKYFLDIMQMILILKDQIDFDTLLKEAASHKTYNRIIRTLTIVYQQFPILNKIKKLPLKRRNIYWKYHSVKGFIQYIDFLDYQIFSYDTVKHSLIEFPQWAFPKPYKSLKIKRLATFIKAIFPN